MCVCVILYFECVCVGVCVCVCLCVCVCVGGVRKNIFFGRDTFADILGFSQKFIWGAV